MKRTFMVVGGLLIALLGFVGCARRVTIRPDLVVSRNQPDWVIRRPPEPIHQAVTDSMLSPAIAPATETPPSPAPINAAPAR